MNSANSNPWVRVVLAAECAPCLLCGEPLCGVCGEHYADCECPGPHQDDLYEYEYETSGGVLYARRRPEPTDEV